MQNPWVLQQCVYRGYSQTDGCMIVRLRVHIHEYIYEYIYAAIYMSIHMYENIISSPLGPWQNSFTQWTTVQPLFCWHLVSQLFSDSRTIHKSHQKLSAKRRIVWDINLAYKYFWDAGSQNIVDNMHQALHLVN